MSHNLKWLCSYETLKFDTPDGELHADEYAIHEGRHLIRIHPENNEQFTIIEDYNLEHTPLIDVQTATAGKQLVSVLPGQHMYYDEFALPDGRIFRTKSSKSEYESLAGKNAGKREKVVTDKEIKDIKKDDDLWR